MVLRQVKQILSVSFNNNIINCVYNIARRENLKPKGKGKQDQQSISIAHSLFLKEDCVIYKNLIFKALPIPTIFKATKKLKKMNLYLKQIQINNLLFMGNLNIQLGNLNR